MLAKWAPIFISFSLVCANNGLNASDAISGEKRAFSAYTSEPLAFHSAKYSSYQPRIRESPQDTVDGLHSKSGDPQEPSRASEERYVGAMREWLKTLAPLQREKAQKIMHNAHPYLKALREAIRNKKSQLASISFDRGMPPETLPRLGMELQQLRASLSRELQRVNELLRSEAGVRMDRVEGEAYWLFPPD